MLYYFNILLSYVSFILLNDKLWSLCQTSLLNVLFFTLLELTVHNFHWCPLRGRPSNFWGWVGWGWFWKKNSSKGLPEEKSASSKNGIKKKFLHCCKPCKKEKCYQVISSFRKLYKTPAKLQPFFPCSLLNSGFGDAVELLLHISIVL